MEDQSAIYAQLAEQLAQCSRRLARLENDAVEAEVIIRSSRLSQEEFVQGFGEELASADKMLSEGRQALQESVQRSGKVLLGFRSVVKNDIFAETQARLDSWPLESFVRREELQRMVVEECSRQKSKVVSS